MSDGARSAVGAGAGAGAAVLEQLAQLPGGRELLACAGPREDVALVGGAVRDLLLGRAPRELDVSVGVDGVGFARELAGALSGAGAAAGAVAHERFGTALVEWQDGRIDVAERRSESYPAPGALPEVRPGSLAEDLARRDFTVNAIAVSLGGGSAGELAHAEHAIGDLRAGRLRVLHEQSFNDDPTRLLRLARYRARLGFEIEQGTHELAAEVLAGGALATVSRARIGAELRLALREADAPAALQAMSDLGVLAAIEPRLRLDQSLLRRALSLLPGDGRAEVLSMASLLLALSIEPDEDPEAVMFELLDSLEFTAGDRERVMRSALLAPGAFKELSLAASPSEMHEALCALTIEAIALGGAMGEGASSVTAAAETWFGRLRHVRLQIGGQDLLDAGVAPGPQIGLRLSQALARKLDGELPDGREAELAAALEGEGW